MSFNAVRCLSLVLLAAVCLVPDVSFAASAAKPFSPAELLQIAKTNRDPEVRQGAILRLGDITEADERNLSVTETLLDIIKTSVDPFVGKSCVRTLTKLQKNVSKRPKTKYINIFTAILKDPKAIPGVRSAIAECFMETLDKDDLPDREAFKTLQDIAKSKTEPNIALRGMCIEAIGSFGNPDSIGMLCELLSDPESYIKEAAAKAVSILLDKDMTAAGNISLAAVNKIVEMVNDDKLDEELRVIVIRADAQMMAAGTPGANKGFDKIVFLVTNGTSDPVVMASIGALGIIGTAQAAAPLMKTYHDFFNEKNPMNEKDVPIRVAVVKALRSVLTTQGLKSTPDLATVHDVASLLSKIVYDDEPGQTDPVPTVKASAIYALGYLYPKKFEPEYKAAVNSLIFQLAVKELDPNMKQSIADSLEAITRVNYGIDPNRWKEWLAKSPYK